MLRFIQLRVFIWSYNISSLVVYGCVLEMDKLTTTFPTESSAYQLLSPCEEHELSKIVSWTLLGKLLLIVIFILKYNKDDFTD